MSKHLSILL
jgi:hypothetical protein